MSDAAIATLVAAVVTILGQLITFLTLWVRLKYGEKKTEELSQKTDVVGDKIDHNTELTKRGTTAATANAKAAAATAVVAVRNTEVLKGKLNGGVDSAVRSALEPIQKLIEDHTAADEKSVGEVNEKLAKLEAYVHDRDHKMRDAIGMLANKLETILSLQQEQNKK